MGKEFRPCRARGSFFFPYPPRIAPSPKNRACEGTGNGKPDHGKEAGAVRVAEFNGRIAENIAMDR